MQEFRAIIRPSIPNITSAEVILMALQKRTIFVLENNCFVMNTGGPAFTLEGLFNMSFPDQGYLKYRGDLTRFSAAPSGRVR